MGDGGMKALQFEVRDLQARCPDDYTYPEFDIVATCDDGTMRHSDATFDTKDAAEVVLAGMEHSHPQDLDQWEVTRVGA